jgi:hypothetical protein
VGLGVATVAVALVVTVGRWLFVADPDIPFSVEHPARTNATIRKRNKKIVLAGFITRLFEIRIKMMDY